MNSRHRVTPAGKTPALTSRRRTVSVMSRRFPAGVKQWRLLLRGDRRAERQETRNEDDENEAGKYEKVFHEATSYGMHRLSLLLGGEQP